MAILHVALAAFALISPLIRDITAEDVDCFDEDTDYPGNDVNLNSVKLNLKPTATECQTLCTITPACRYFTWSTNQHCYLKSSKSRASYEFGAISGPKSCRVIPEALAVAILSSDDVDGTIGEGREFSLDNVGGLVFVSDVEDSADCCKACQQNYKETQMFNFHMEDKQCTCLKSSPNLRPFTSESRVMSGSCSETQHQESHYDYRYRRSSGTFGLHRFIHKDSVDSQGGVDTVNTSGECCDECRKIYTDTEMFQFDSFYYNYCHCFKSIPGTKPVTSELKHVAGLCGTSNN